MMFKCSYFAPPDVVIAERYASGILHRTCIKFWHKDLVIFSKWITNIEIALKNFKAMLNCLKHELVIQMIF